MERVMKRMKEISGGKVLDVATGRGEFIDAMVHSLKDFEKIIGIDTYDKSFKAAEEHFKDKPVEFLKMDALNMKFEDETFDTVAISNSLHHFNKPKNILNEMFRVLKKDGTFIISEMCNDDDQSNAQLTHVNMHHWWGEVDTRLGIIHNKTYSEKELKSFGESAGFSTVEVFTFSYPMENPKDEKIKKRFLDIMDPYVDRLKEHEDYEILKNRGEQLKDMLEENGYAPARIVVIIGKK